jgi:chromate transporter
MSNEVTPLNRPKSKTELFVGFSLLALQGVGGVLTVAQQELVDRRKWMSRAQFVEEWSIAQIMPGPNIINLALMYGRQQFGLAGALVAAAGLLIAPLCVVLTLAILFGGVSDNPVSKGALKGMGAVSAGLIVATGLKLSTTLQENPLGLRTAWLFSLSAFVSVGILRMPLAWVLLSLGLLACWIAFRKLKATAYASSLASANPSESEGNNS